MMLLYMNSCDVTDSHLFSLAQKQSVVTEPVKFMLYSCSGHSLAFLFTITGCILVKNFDLTILILSLFLPQRNIILYDKGEKKPEILQ